MLCIKSNLPFDLNEFSITLIFTDSSSLGKFFWAVNGCTINLDKLNIITLVPLMFIMCMEDPNEKRPQLIHTQDKRKHRIASQFDHLFWWLRFNNTHCIHSVEIKAYKLCKALSNKKMHMWFFLSLFKTPCASFKTWTYVCMCCLNQILIN